MEADKVRGNDETRTGDDDDATSPCRRILTHCSQPIVLVLHDCCFTVADPPSSSRSDSLRFLSRCDSEFTRTSSHPLGRLRASLLRPQCTFLQRGRCLARRTDRSMWTRPALLLLLPKCDRSTTCPRNSRRRSRGTATSKTTKTANCPGRPFSVRRSNRSNRSARCSALRGRGRACAHLFDSR